MPGRSLLVSLVILLACAALPAAAQAADPIEGTWSFNGGEITLLAQPDGSFRGTVVKATTFDTCPHAVGEYIWTDVRQQPDGQYWGGHQWLNSDCSPASIGRNAWRLLQNEQGETFLRVCFASQSSGLQPKIAPDGTATDTAASGEPCVDSTLLAPPPAAPPSFRETVVLPKPGARKCLSKRSFRIRLKEPKGDALNSASVFVRGKRVRTVKRDRISAPITLTGLPKGRYTVKITAKTVLGRTISGSRKYRTCTKKRRGSNTGPL